MHAAHARRAERRAVEAMGTVHARVRSARPADLWGGASRGGGNPLSDGGPLGMGRAPPRLALSGDGGQASNYLGASPSGLSSGDPADIGPSPSFPVFNKVEHPTPPNVTVGPLMAFSSRLYSVQPKAAPHDLPALVSPATTTLRGRLG